MIAYYFFGVCIHLFIGLWICAFVFPLTDRQGRQRRIQKWSYQLMDLCGVELQVRHLDPHAEQPSRALMVSNHISWLDIFVINALDPCRFVAKSEIRSWPLIGWLSAKSGTIFISRGRVRDVRRIFEGLVTSLAIGERVAFFPEGTTAVQGNVLPFHANLFEAAIDAKVPVQPYAIRYLNHNDELHPAVEFVGDITFVRSMIAILKAGHIKAELIVLPAIYTVHAHRRELAQEARMVIAAALSCEINDR